MTGSLPRRGFIANSGPMRSAKNPMSDSGIARLQKMFLAALEAPSAERESWLVKECGSDSKLLENVRTLLGHAQPAFDPLEQELDAALAVTPRADLEERHEPPEDDAPAAVDCDLFLSKLSDVGVLSPDEFASVSESMVSDPQQLASQLVTAGKL